MNRHTQTASWLVLLLGVIFAAGCTSSRPLQIEPMGHKGVAIQPKFEDACYRYDADGTLYFVARSHTVDKVTGQGVDQIITARVFWRPVGGKTSLNKTSLNATYRYVLMTEHAVGVYEGAGFVRIWGKNGKKITARMMDGDLRLTEASTGFTDTLGRSRMRGGFSAAYDDGRAMDMLLQAHRDLFNRSLHLTPEAPKSAAMGLMEALQGGATTQATTQAATQAASQPSTRPAPPEEPIPMPRVE